MLRYAARKKKFQKNFQKIFNFFFQKFQTISVKFILGYLSSAVNLSYACKNLGGLGPLVWAKKGSAPTCSSKRLSQIII
jgi:hypothetical protein